MGKVQSFALLEDSSVSYTSLKILLKFPAFLKNKVSVALLGCDPSERSSFPIVFKDLLSLFLFQNLSILPLSYSTFLAVEYSS